MMAKPAKKKDDEPLTWDEVANSPEYRKMSRAEREAARREYFDNVIAPTVSKDELAAVRKEFDTDTRPRRAPSEMGEPLDYDRMMADPTTGTSESRRAWESFGRFWPQLGQAVGGLTRDVAEMGGPFGKKGADVVGLPTSASIAETKRLDAPLLATTGGKVGDVAQVAGKALPLAFAPGGATVLGSAGYGALFGGGMVPAEDWGERGTNVLATAGVSGGVTGATRAGLPLWRAFVSPFGEKGQERLATDLVNRFRYRTPEATQNALIRTPPTGAASTQELIPGSKATLAEVTGDPGIAQLQRAAQAKIPETASALEELKISRVEARKDVLLKQFGTSANKETAEALREATAFRLYREAWEAPIDAAKAKAAAPEIKELLARPSIQRARSNALDIAKEEGEVLSAADLKAPSVKGLHFMKKSIDKEIKAAKNANDDDEARRLLSTQKKLLGVMDDISTPYKKAREKYTEQSKPINQMEVGAFLYGKLFPALSDLATKEGGAAFTGITPAAYGRAVKEGDRMARQATGFSGARLRDILTTDQWNAILNLGRDVARESAAAKAATVPGSPTAQYLAGKNIMRQILGPLGMPESWLEGMLKSTFGKSAAQVGKVWPYNQVEKGVQNKLTEILLNPEKYQKVSADIAARQAKTIPRVMNFLTQRALPPASVGMGMEYAGAQQ